MLITGGLAKQNNSPFAIRHSPFAFATPIEQPLKEERSMMCLKVEARIVIHNFISRRNTANHHFMGLTNAALFRTLSLTSP